MATLYRKRYNLATTTLGAQLTSGSTSITFATALKEGGASGSNIASLGTDEYLALSVDDEVVYLTAYTSGATSGTISRGQEGTVDATHANGNAISIVPTKLDVLGMTDRGVWAASTAYRHGDVVTYGSHRFVRQGDGFTSGTAFDPSNWLSLSEIGPLSPALYGTATTYDEEFDGTGTSLPSGLSWVNQGTSTFLNQYGAGIIQGPAASGINWRAVVKSLASAPSAWLLTAFVSMTSKGTSGDQVSGLVLRENSSGKLLTFYFYSSNTSCVIYVVRWASPTDGSPTIIVNGLQVHPYDRPKFLRIRKNSSTSYDFEFSHDGRAWFQALAAHDPTASMTPDQFGFGGYHGGSEKFDIACDFFRLR